MGVIIRPVVGKNKTTYRFDIHIKGRGRERPLIPDVFSYNKPKTTEERAHNSEVKIILSNLLSEKLNSLGYESNAMDSPVDLRSPVVGVLNEYLAGYRKKDRRKVSSMVEYFSAGFGSKTFRDLNDNLTAEFKEYLSERTKATTARAYFSKFKQAIERARIAGKTKYHIYNFRGRFKTGGRRLTKEVLEPFEINLIAKTKCDNPTVKNAALFSLTTGMDFADMFELKWGHIRQNGFIKPREKTGEGNVRPFNQAAKSILQLMDRSTEFVFQGLPNRSNRDYSNAACNKTLKAMVKRAGIDKHITWHCLRHSFGTNIEESDNLVVAEMLGHADDKMVKVYRRIKQERLQRAADSLPGIDLSSVKAIKKAPLEKRGQTHE